MKTFALCAAEFERSVRRAAGVKPRLCPPVTAMGFDPHWLEGHDFIYFKLHGLPDQPYWYGDSLITAITAQQIREASLGGAVVFVANCHLVESPMLPVLLAAGARAVIGGPGPNYAGRARLEGADLLGLYIRLGLQYGITLATAFELGLTRLRAAPNDPAAQDTLAFRIFEA